MKTECPFVVGEWYPFRGSASTAKFIAYVPEANENKQAVFVVNGLIASRFSNGTAGGDETSMYDILPTALKSKPTQDEVRYRELSEGEHLRATDEYLSRDCSSWFVVGFSNQVTPYSPGKHRPTRRVVEAPAPKLVERWVVVVPGIGRLLADKYLFASEEAARVHSPDAHSYHKIEVPE